MIKNKALIVALVSFCALTLILLVLTIGSIQKKSKIIWNNAMSKIEIENRISFLEHELQRTNSLYIINSDKIRKLNELRLIENGQDIEIIIPRNESYFYFSPLQHCSTCYEHELNLIKDKGNISIIIDGKNKNEINALIKKYSISNKVYLRFTSYTKQALTSSPIYFKIDSLKHTHGIYFPDPTLISTTNKYLSK